jgi:hypothetical protein
MPVADRPSHIFLQPFRRFRAIVSDMFRFTLPVVFVVAVATPEARSTMFVGLFYRPLSPFSEIWWKLDFFHGLPCSICEPAPVIG